MGPRDQIRLAVAAMMREPRISEASLAALPPVVVAPDGVTLTELPDSTLLLLDAESRGGPQSAGRTRQQISDAVTGTRARGQGYGRTIPSNMRPAHTIGGIVL
jgi:hypothetical protein